MTSTPAQSDTLPWSESLGQDLLRFLSFRLNCRETAAELAQETFLRLHKSSLERPPENPRALAFRIADNLAIDHLRKTTLRNRHHADVAEDVLNETIPCPNPGPERILMGEQRFAQLQTALGELSQMKTATNCPATSCSS